MLELNFLNLYGNGDWGGMISVNYKSSMVLWYSYAMNWINCIRVLREHWMLLTCWMTIT